MKIVEVVKRYVGTQEKPGNKGWYKPEFQERMEKAGWDIGEAWCCIFTEAIFKESYPEHFDLFDKLFSDSATKTLSNFKKAGFAISSIPVVGSLMIMQYYENNIAQWPGHAGVPILLSSNSEWDSVEGNTSGKKTANGTREGDQVAVIHRSLMYSPTGLRVAGFVLIRETLKITE